MIVFQHQKTLQGWNSAMIRYVSVVALCLSISLLWSHGAAVSVENGDVEMDVFRLPGGVVPVTYELWVDTDLEKFTFSGRVQVTVTAASTTCQIAMNAKDLNVTRLEVTDLKSGQPLNVVNWTLVDRNEQLIVQLNKAICLMPTRSYTIDLDYVGTLRTDMSGFYRSWYKEDNQTKWMAVTHFEPTYARRAFPCFDEPAMRATFKVSIRRRSDQISLSNMPLSSSTKIKYTNLYWDNYEETPSLPTYMFGFFIGDLYGLKTRTMTVYAQRDNVNQIEYIAHKLPKLLETIETFTGMDYMLPKLDFITIPDFSQAMENLGMNAYGEAFLLLPRNSKAKLKEFGTTVVQHEISHQWFGDLVTVAWWDYVWMKEGFATYFQYLGTRVTEPDWRLEDTFTYEVFQRALELDQSPKHAMSGRNVKTNDEIHTMFDEIAYVKAGSVLRMFHYVVTEENFKKALNVYLNRNKYAASTPKDLCEAFETVLYEEKFDFKDNFTVTDFMNSWTEQAGYPLVNVTRVNNTIIATQERFSVYHSNETDPTKWIIGLTHTTEFDKNFTNVRPTLWLKNDSIVLTNQSQTGWYIFNLQSIGFYRVNYDDDNWNALINQLHNDHVLIHFRNRAQLVDDAFNLARANKVDYILPLRVSEYLVKEDDLVPWYSAKEAFDYMLMHIRRCKHSHSDLKTYVKYLSGLAYKKTEKLVANHLKNDHFTLKAWNAFSNWACKLDNEYCTTAALNYFEEWRHIKWIPADIKDVAFCEAVKRGGPEVWNSILNVYTNPESPSDRQSALWALACSKDHVQLSKYLDFMFNGHNGQIRPHDFVVMYQTLATTPEGISALLEFLTNKWDRIINHVIKGELIATSIYSALASNVVLDEEIKKMDDLRKNLSVPEYLRRKFNTSYRVVENNRVWFKKYHPKIGDYAKAILIRLGLEVYVKPQGSTLAPPVNPPKAITTEKPIAPSSSSASPRTQSLALVLQVIFATILVGVSYCF